MKLIILAAGKGNRLKPLTDNVPKCLVEFNNIPIIDYLISISKEFDFDKIIVVTGYKSKILENHLKTVNNIEFCYNKDYHKTNMVSSFISAKKHFNDDIIVSYSDIIFKKEILKKVIQSTEKIGVVVDNQWEKLWKIRMENPLEDAESLKIVNNQIIEIGLKTTNINDINSQFIGLMRFSKDIFSLFTEFYQKLDRKILYRGESFENMYFTTLLQLLIDHGFKISPIYINGGWIEIDSASDLDNYRINKISFDYS